ncbi:HAD-IA family hydrolase [Micromonospora sp. NBC_01813]|uniref:HAD-IA family hydrolase n=1 Tax=Micromonospora sp. NBC_01813 TaxID=2975988 RepID=UPI002DD9380F|nr:HAD-IA family hydrolase [Micromonospora sp. NBC_01813]WSA08373.1 HAD-IA family hydrolase [Micromonospora sp. NBC_01813]
MTAGPSGGVTSWLVFDYGQVISLPQPPDTMAAMAAIAAVPPTTFTDGYWRHRLAYDAGCPAEQYWSQVVGRPLSAADPLVAELDLADIASWSHLNPRTVALIDDLAHDGHGLALLSNAPASLAATIDAADWAAVLHHRLFSCRLGLTKPDPAIFAELLRQLGAPATEVTFVDDRPENCQAATDAGLTALLYPQVPTPSRR